jgi:hypothetical protein
MFDDMGRDQQVVRKGRGAGGARAVNADGRPLTKEEKAALKAAEKQARLEQKEADKVADLANSCGWAGMLLYVLITLCTCWLFRLRRHVPRQKLKHRRRQLKQLRRQASRKQWQYASE